MPKCDLNKVAKRNSSNVVFLFFFQIFLGYLIFFQSGFFFHEHSRFTGQLGKGERVPI